jgi:hypothetical protein
MAMHEVVTQLRVPAALRGRVAPMLVIADRVARDHLDEEYRDLARTLLGRLARKRPSPLVRGDERIWAGTVLYALGQLNFLFDPRSTPHMTGDALAATVDVPQQTLANKAKVVRDLLRLRPLDPELSRREHLADPLTATFFRYSSIR